MPRIFIYNCAYTPNDEKSKEPIMNNRIFSLHFNENIG